MPSAEPTKSFLRKAWASFWQWLKAPTARRPSQRLQAEPGYRADLKALARSAAFASYRAFLEERSFAVVQRLLTAPLTDEELRETRARAATYIEIADILDTLIRTIEEQDARDQRAADERQQRHAPARADGRFWGNPTFFGRNSGAR